MGVCAHIAQNNPGTKFGVSDWGAFLEDASNIQQVIDGSDSEENIVRE